MASALRASQSAQRAESLGKPSQDKEALRSALTDASHELDKAVQTFKKFPSSSGSATDHRDLLLRKMSDYMQAFFRFHTPPLRYVSASLQADLAKVSLLLSVRDSRRAPVSAGLFDSPKVKIPRDEARALDNAVAQFKNDPGSTATHKAVVKALDVFRKAAFKDQFRQHESKILDEIRAERKEKLKQKLRQEAGLS